MYTHTGHMGAWQGEVCNMYEDMQGEDDICQASRSFLQVDTTSSAASEMLHGNREERRKQCITSVNKCEHKQQINFIQGKIYNFFLLLSQKKMAHSLWLWLVKVAHSFLSEQS